MSVSGKRASPLLVEFCGLGGAGKTTVATECTAQLRQAGLVCLPRWEKSPRSFLTDLAFSGRNVGTIAAVHQFHRGIVRGFALDTERRAFANQYALNASKVLRYLRMINRRMIKNPDVVIFDQGVVNWLTCVAPADVLESLGGRALLGKVYRQWPTLLVFVETPPCLAEQRLNDRRYAAGKGRGQRSDIIVDNGTREKSLRWAAEAVRGAEDNKVLVLDGLRSAEELGAEVAMAVGEDAYNVLNQEIP